VAAEFVVLSERIRSVEVERPSIRRAIDKLALGKANQACYE
jgi:hypothetical protein